MITLGSIPHFARNANRLREILTVLSKYGLADWLSRVEIDFVKGWFKGRDGVRLTGVSHESRIRLALSELGPTFIKLGQMLSTRADLIGPVLAKELSMLQEDAPADSFEAARGIVEAELGQPLAELFADFDARPLASASIAQVHRAQLRDGAAVVVKVQHAGIEARVRTDLDILLGLAELAEQFVPEWRRYRPRATAGEFQRTLIRELDFGREERNLQQFAANFADNEGIRFPQPFAEYSTARVLTMEYLEGLKLAEPQGLREVGYDLSEIARRGAESYLEMIFRDGFYHADPHPGNFVVLPGGVIGILDCGMVGRIDDDLREQIEDMLLAIVNRDAVRLTTIVTRLGAAPPDLDRAGLSSDLADLVSFHGTRALDSFNLGQALTDMTEVMRRYQIVLPANIAMLMKVLIMLEGTSKLLNPHFSLTELIQPYQKKLLLRRLSPGRHLQKLRRLYHEWEHLGEVLPRTLVEVLQSVRSGRFDVHLEHRRLEPSINRLVLGMLTSALFLGSALLWSRQVPPLIGEISVLGAAGYLLSLLLGVRLIWAIRKSGKLDQKS